MATTMIQRPTYAAAPSAAQGNAVRSSVVPGNALPGPSTPSKALISGSQATTPNAIPPAAPTPPGTWQHPQMAQIARRQADSTLSPRNLRSAAYGAAFLVLTFVFPEVVTGWLKSTAPDVAKYFPTYLPHILRLALLAQITLALRPLWARADNIDDIPLTPSQRRLLGLKPSSLPATPGTIFHTPPRVPRSTPRTGSSHGSGGIGSSRAATVGSDFGRSTSGSPMGGSPLAGRGVGGSPYSPATGSPLVRKAMEGTRRLSGSRTSSPLAFGASSSLLGSGLPSGSVFDASVGNAGGRNASVGLSNKWLYQRRRDGSTLYTQHELLY